MKVIYKFKSMFIFFIFLCLIGCSAAGNTTSPSEISTRDTVFYITPVIDGVGFCSEALDHSPPFKSANEAINWCIEKGYNSAKALDNKLEALEPGGANGKVQIGYELGIPLLNLYDKQDEEWVINETKINTYFELIKNTNRPVVIYLMANHFDSKGPLSTELSKDPRNLMLLKSGDPPTDDYFGNSVIPFTLLTDESIPVNHYRFEALRYIGRMISGLPQEVKDRIIAITMAGEVHQMFPDFTNGTSEYDDFQVTDYSPNSIKKFRLWLEKKYGTIEKMNDKFGSVYNSFNDVFPPSKNINKEKLNSYTEHYDAYAAGVIPISGWVWDPETKIENLILYVDGIKVNDIKQGYNRLDVYRAVEEVTDPNVGFRYDLDYRDIAPGRHNAQVVAKINGQLFLMDQSEFVIVDRNQGTPAPLPNNPTNFRDFGKIGGVRHWLDYPKPLTAVYYNPLARDWNEYRDAQVSDFLEYFWAVAKDEGMPADKLFSHQILPTINSTWNPELFMGDLSIGQDIPYKLGINLYGGATNSDIIRKFIKGREYGVPEYHTQQWKSYEAVRESLRAHYKDNAKFISPYYISIIPDSLKPFEEDTLQKFNIRNDNEMEGSNMLYKSIIDFSKQ